MNKDSIRYSFLALLSQEIARIEKMYGRKKFDPTYVEILVIDELPTKKEKIELEGDLLNTLIKQGWKISHFKIEIEQPARITISFQISPQPQPQ